MQLDERLAQRFWSKVDIQGPNDCWPWKRSLKKNGYGQFFTGTKKNPKMMRAHRVAWLLCEKALPSGKDLDHVCHNLDKDCPGGWTCPHRRCCNPAHLCVKTRSQNMEDSPRVQKTRQSRRCRRGHLWKKNERWREGKNGKSYRVCISCVRQLHLERYHRVKSTVVDPPSPKE